MNKALEKFLEIAKSELDTVFDSLKNDTFDRVTEMILKAQSHGNRLHITGIGKPAHVANYIASLFSSVGTPTYFLHGTEAVHGSCGQLAEEDVVICISNSGNTAELKATAAAVRNYGCKIIAVTGNKDSWLAKFADCHIFAGVRHEGGPLNRAPRNSYLVETLVLQCISVVLQEHVNLTPAQYVKRHPGGTLGQLRENEK